MSPTFRALHNANYRLYLAGSVVSNTGTWMMRVAQDWLVLQPLHGGSAAVGITTGLQFLPILLLTPYAGVVADRMPKRTLLQITQATMGVASLVSGVVAVSGHSALWIVYLCALALGVGAAFDAPARQSFVSEMVDTDDLSNAVGLNSASFNAARLVGPAGAGLLIAALGSGQVATGVVFLINAASYAAVIAQLRRMDPDLLHPVRRQVRGPHQLVEAVAYVRSQPRMLFVLAVVFFVGTFGMNFQLTSALMATQVYGKGAGEFGLLGSALAVGSLTGALMAARRVHIRLRLVAIGAVAFAVAEIVAAVMPSYGLFALCCPLIGFSALTVANTANSTIQLTADPAYRGRAMALYMTVFQGGTPLGAPLIGWIGQEYGPRWTLVVGGVMVLVGVTGAVLGFTLTARRVRTPCASVLTLSDRAGSLADRV